MLPVSAARGSDAFGPSGADTACLDRRRIETGVGGDMQGARVTRRGWGLLVWRGVCHSPRSGSGVHGPSAERSPQNGDDTAGASASGVVRGFSDSRERDVGRPAALVDRCERTTPIASGETPSVASKT